LITSRFLSSDNREVLRQDWRLTQVQYTLYIHYMELSLSQIPARNMELVKHKILVLTVVPCMLMLSKFVVSHYEQFTTNTPIRT